MVHNNPILLPGYALLLIIGAIGVPLAGGNTLVQSPKAQAKARVNRLAVAADDRSAREDCGLDHITWNCMNDFKEAADALQRYIDDFLDRKSEEYAICQYELGGLREKEGKDYEAKRVYKICLKTAKEKGFSYLHQPLVDLTNARLNRVERRLEKIEKPDRPRERWLNNGP